MLDDPKIIAAVVLILTNIAALIKVYADVLKVKADRRTTKSERDADSEKLHDTILKHGFAIQQLKDNQALTATVVDDLRDQCATLNTNLVKLDTNVANLTEAIKELRHAQA